MLICFSWTRNWCDFGWVDVASSITASIAVVTDIWKKMALQFDWVIEATAWDWCWWARYCCVSPNWLPPIGQAEIAAIARQLQSSKQLSKVVVGVDHQPREWSSMLRLDGEHFCFVLFHKCRARRDGYHFEVIRLADSDVDELVSIRKNLAERCVRGLIMIAIHRKMLDLQMDDFCMGACDQLVHSWWISRSMGRQSRSALKAM